MGIHRDVHLEPASMAVLKAMLAFSSRVGVCCTNFDMSGVVLNQVLQFYTSRNWWLKKNSKQQKTTSKSPSLRAQCLGLSLLTVFWVFLVFGVGFFLRR